MEGNQAEDSKTHHREQSLVGNLQWNVVRSLAARINPQHLSATTNGVFPEPAGLFSKCLLGKTPCCVSMSSLWRRGSGAADVNI